LAYQGYARGLDLELLRRLNEMATGGAAPDLTVVLDIEPEQARLDGSRLDRLESEGQTFSRKVAAGFRDLARREPERIKLVNAAREVEAVHAEIWKLVSR
jgi:dTMP kinase